MRVRTHDDEPARAAARRRRRGFVVAGICVLAFALLTASVFSIANRSREVAAQSVTLHALNETLRAGTVVRAQVTFAAYLAGSGGRDAAVEASLREATGGLADLERAREPIRDDLATDPALENAIRSFSVAAADAIRRTADGDSARARAIVSARLVPSFEQFRDGLVERRNTALVEVTAAGSRLGRLGGLASFLVAFVLPTIAVVVYRQVTRRSRETVDLAVALGRERGRWRRRHQLLERSLSDLAHALSAGADSADPARLRRLAEDVEALLAVLDGSRRYAFTDVRPAEELGELAVELGSDGVDLQVRCARPVAAWADAAIFRQALRSLAFDARDAGAHHIDVAIGGMGDLVEIVVAHDGSRLPLDVASLVFERAGAADRAAVEAGAVPIRLVAAQELLEAMHGTLEHMPHAPRPSFLVRLPAAGPEANLGRRAEDSLVATAP